MSISGHIFVQWKAEEISNKISKVHSMLIHIFFWYVSAFVHYSKVLTVVHLKLSSVNIIEKIRDFLLFEAEINFSNKIYFDIRLIKRSKVSGFLPQK